MASPCRRGGASAASLVQPTRILHADHAKNIGMKSVNPDWLTAGPIDGSSPFDPALAAFVIMVRGMVNIRRRPAQASNWSIASARRHQIGLIAIAGDAQARGMPDNIRQHRLNVGLDCFTICESIHRSPIPHLKRCKAGCSSCVIPVMSGVGPCSGHPGAAFIFLLLLALSWLAVNAESTGCFRAHVIGQLM